MVAVTSKDHCKQRGGRRRCTHGVPMSTVGSAAQKAGKWKVVPLKVKPRYVSKVQEMGRVRTGGSLSCGR